MIWYRQGNIFESKAAALVNPVNCVGVSGKGLALEFKRRFPDSFEAYRTACIMRSIKVGKVYPFWDNTVWIVNFPTKRDWRKPSQIDWIRWGLADLRDWLAENHVQSVAIPALGCGLGGLAWEDVKKEIENFLSNSCEVFVYGP